MDRDELISAPLVVDSEEDVVDAQASQSPESVAWLKAKSMCSLGPTAVRKPGQNNLSKSSTQQVKLP